MCNDGCLYSLPAHLQKHIENVPVEEHHPNATFQCTEAEGVALALCVGLTKQNNDGL